MEEKKELEMINLDELVKDKVPELPPIERDELIRRARAMRPIEKEIFCSQMPSELLLKALSDRLNHMESTLNDITKMVKKG